MSLTPGQAVEEIKALLQDIQPIVTKISVLRHNDIAHRNRKLSTFEVFQKAKLTEQELGKLVNKTWEIAVSLLKLVGEPSHLMILSSELETLALLKDLTAHHECQLMHPEEIAR